MHPKLSGAPARLTAGTGQDYLKIEVRPEWYPAKDDPAIPQNG